MSLAEGDYKVLHQVLKLLIIASHFSQQALQNTAMEPKDSIVEDMLAPGRSLFRRRQRALRTNSFKCILVASSELLKLHRMGVNNKYLIFTPLSYQETQSLCVPPSWCAVCVWDLCKGVSYPYGRVDAGDNTQNCCNSQQELCSRKRYDHYVQVVFWEAYLCKKKAYYFTKWTQKSVLICREIRNKSKLFTWNIEPY